MNEVPIRVPAQFAAIHTHLIVQTLVLQAFGFDAFVAQRALLSVFSEQEIVVIWQERDFPVPNAPPDRSVN